MRRGTTTKNYTRDESSNEKKFRGTGGPNGTAAKADIPKQEELQGGQKDGGRMRVGPGRPYDESRSIVSGFLPHSPAILSIATSEIIASGVSGCANNPVVQLGLRNRRCSCMSY